MAPSPPRLTGDERAAMARVLADRYRDGASIRSLAADFGRSYGLVQRLLREAGVQTRPRGGADPASPETRAERQTVASASAVEADPGLIAALEEAEQKVRKAEKRLAKAERARARLTRRTSTKKERRAAKEKVAKRSRKAGKAAQRLQRIREQMDSRGR
ncbi:helix-turn-helix domain-containing protein [Acidipropionibacterium virtanenii]|uniref:Helix-turn-helix domain-containing protein n=1 Tax=Acidipropionibacterium virtanenii TaxID=2057246 RepID=A0A344UT28_9ACTN|nr:helix-turn-helix domain-containing protein [Acidipropionibacterium virtanenii]AXE38426.1 hypothetical protein JS278_01250 [Acidipropionibacterium virtanenii]